MKIADLSVDALAKLEAKLLADLETVRRFKALLQEHADALTTPAAPKAGDAVPAVARVAMPAVLAPPPAPPRPTWAEAVETCLATYGGRTVTQDEFRRAVHELTRSNPRAIDIKNLFNRLVRRGTLVVVEKRTGRGGSRYRCTLPPAVAPPAAASAIAPAAAGSAAPSEA